jgi:hypothetical protein
MGNEWIKEIMESDDFKKEYNKEYNKEIWACVCRLKERRHNGSMYIL